MRRTLDWQPYYDVLEEGRPPRERLAAYAAIARQRFDTDAFDEFCATHLGHLDEVLWEFFGTDIVKDAVRQKVAALFPAHEVDEFTELFWARVQRWRAENAAPASTA